MSVRCESISVYQLFNNSLKLLVRNGEKMCYILKNFSEFVAAIYMFIENFIDSYEFLCDHNQTLLFELS